MLLVHEKKQGYGKWEVAWTWLPFFLAADSKLIKEVDQEMTKAFRGEDTRNGGGRILPVMHQKVVDLILKKYPIPGLDKYLEALKHVNPEGT